MSLLYVAITRAKKGMLPAHGDEPGDLRTKWGRSNVCSLRTGMSLYRL